MERPGPNSSETKQSSSEKLRNEESSAELAEMAREKLQKLETKAEHSNEHKSEKLEVARDKIEHQAEATPEPNDSERKAPQAPVTKLDKEVSYRHTMKTLQRHMKPATRAFSQLIHHPAVDTASEVLGKTVLRPSVTTGATATALIFGGGLYVTARYYGFALSGSEFILALIIGGLIGLAIEGLAKMLRSTSRFFKQ